MGMSSQIAEREDNILVSDLRGRIYLCFVVYIYDHTFTKVRDWSLNTGRGGGCYKMGKSRV